MEEKRPVGLLRIYKNDGTTLPYEIFADEPVTIGSDAVCDIRIKTDVVRPQHCKITFNAETSKLEVIPLDSKAIVSVDTIKIEGLRALNEGQILKIANSKSMSVHYFTEKSKKRKVGKKAEQSTKKKTKSSTTSTTTSTTVSSAKKSSSPALTNQPSSSHSTEQLAPLLLATKETKVTQSDEEDVFEIPTPHKEQPAPSKYNRLQTVPLAQQEEEETQIPEYVQNKPQDTLQSKKSLNTSVVMSQHAQNRVDDEIDLNDLATATLAHNIVEQPNPVLFDSDILENFELIDHISALKQENEKLREEISSFENDKELVARVQALQKELELKNNEIKQGSSSRNAELVLKQMLETKDKEISQLQSQLQKVQQQSTRSNQKIQELQRNVDILEKKIREDAKNFEEEKLQLQIFFQREMAQKEKEIVSFVHQVLGQKASDSANKTDPSKTYLKVPDHVAKNLQQSGLKSLTQQN